MRSDIKYNNLPADHYAKIFCMDGTKDKLTFSVTRQCSLGLLVFLWTLNEHASCSTGQ